MILDSGLGLQVHQVLITSGTMNIDSQDGKNWTITFTVTAERTAIQEDTCLTANLPDLYGCYGDGLGYFLATYAYDQTHFPRIWGDFPIIDFNHELHVLDAGLSLTRASTATYIDDGVLKYAAVNEPRFEDKGLLIEGAGINLLDYSQDFSNAAWSKVPVTISSNVVAAPDGALTGSKIIANVGSAQHEIGNAYTGLSVGGSVSSSIYAKAGEKSILQICWFGGATGVSSAYANFDLNTGGTSGNAASIRIVPIGNGWYRCQVSTPITGNMTGGCNAIVGFCDSLTDGRRPTTVGDGISGFFIWGFQSEAGSLPSSYIPTASAAVTRQPDSFTTTMSNIKRIRRVYTPAGQSTAIDETIPYAGTLCPNGHLQLLQAWDTE
jgi:hypothetical protein